MLVDAVTSRRPTGASENSVLGPFHVADAPDYPMGTNICPDQKGEDLVVRGKQPDFNFRGVFRTGPDGAYGSAPSGQRTTPSPQTGPATPSWISSAGIPIGPRISITSSRRKAMTS